MSRMLANAVESIPALLSAERLFPWNNVIVISWLALILAPKARITFYLTLIPPLFLAVIYSAILFVTVCFPSPGAPPLDFFSLAGWMNLLKSPYMVVGTTNHFCVMDLVGGLWMSNDFYQRYTVGQTRWGRLYFTLPLLTGDMGAPLGI